MPYAVALFEAVVFTFAGAAATLAAVFFALLRPFFAFAWRMWLWGSIGFVVANLVLLAILFPSLGAPATPIPRHTDVWDSVLLGLVLFGPLLFSSAGVILGCWYGWRRARSRTAQPSV